MTADPVVVGAVSAIIGSILTFLVQRKDANTRAQDTTVNALSATIERLEKHIKHLDDRLVELETQLDSMSKENVTLIREVHELRKALAEYQTDC